MDIHDDQTTNSGNESADAPTRNALVSDDIASDSEKASRKRERERSIEPNKASTNTEPESADSKETRTPAKKNRTSAQLDVTEEEEESSSGVSASPPTESKIRQISQGVEDMTWKHIRKGCSPDRDLEMQAHEPESTTEDQLAAEAQGVYEQEDVPVDGLDAEPIKAKVAGGDEVSVPPALLQGDNPPQVADDAGEDEHAGQADPTEISSDAQPYATAAFHNSEAQSKDSAPSDIPPAPTTATPSRRSSESEAEAEKGLKRKLRDRTVSERLIPGEVAEGDNVSAPKVGAAKRQRDDADADANPRVTKRPTPPPEEQEANGEKGDQKVEAPSSQATKATTTPAAPSTPKIGGFMAYASTNSPFTSVSGPSLFNKPQSPPPGSPFASTSTSFASAFASSSPSKSSFTSPETPLPQKRTGFEAFASTSSPFASVAKRPKSPPPPAFGGSSLARSRSPSRHPTSVRTGGAFSTSAFTAYAAGGAHGFSTPKPRSERASPAPSEGSTRANSIFDSGNKDDTEEESGNGVVSFSERLRSQKDDEENEESERLKLTEQEVHTGEEDEETVYQVRGKLYALSSQNQWKERGTGTLKLNVRREDGTGARLVMRKEAVYTVLLNATLFKGMKCFIAQDPRYIRFSVFEGTAATHYNLRVQTAKIADELIEEINSHIPGE